MARTQSKASRATNGHTKGTRQTDGQQQRMPTRPKRKSVVGGRSGSSLTPRQARFVKEYLIDMNGTQAAIRAGYSKHTANEQAARLLAKVSVKAAVEAGAAKQHEQLDLTAQKVLTELLGVGYATVTSTDVRVSDKLRALELLAKHLGLLTEQVDHKHSGRFELVWAEDE